MLLWTSGDSPGSLPVSLAAVASEAHRRGLAWRTGAVAGGWAAELTGPAGTGYGPVSHSPARALRLALDRYPRGLTEAVRP